MIKKLRRKFVLATAGGSMLVLLAVFAVVLLATREGMRRQTRMQLEMALNQASSDSRPPLAPAGRDTPPSSRLMNGPQGRSRCFTVLVTEEGAVAVQPEAFFLQEELDAGEIEELALAAAGEGGSEGGFPQHRLRFLKRAVRAGTLVAFADTSAESAVLSQLVRSCLLVGAASALVLLGISMLLARWAVGPVERAWRQQKQFVADASHELKTPLTVIISNADMILARPREDPRPWAENIQAEGARMKALTQELLALARTDRLEDQPPHEKVDLSYLVADCCLSFEAAAYESGRGLALQVEEGAGVSGSPADFARLVGILLDNAVRYAAGDGDITVTLGASGRWVRLAVSNPGGAIPQEDLSRIFQRFVRGDPSRSQEGFGLGLSIAQGIVLAHKGKIWAQSQNGRNTFFVELPAAK